jgi:hypothetical protein
VRSLDWISRHAERRLEQTASDGTHAGSQRFYLEEQLWPLMKIFIVLLLTGIGAYLLYLSTSVRWTSFPAICISGSTCFDGYALGLGALSLVLAAMATRTE